MHVEEHSQTTPCADSVPREGDDVQPAARRDEEDEAKTNDPASRSADTADTTSVPKVGPTPIPKEASYEIPGGNTNRAGPRRTQSFDGFRTKPIDFLDQRNVPVLLQNEFGPCALLALANVLLLRRALGGPPPQENDDDVVAQHQQNNGAFSPDRASISLETVVTAVANRLLEANATRAALQDETGAQTRQALEDAMKLLPKMEHGLDVNVSFRDATTFEYTECLAVFDLLDVSLVHGWCADPDQDADAVAVLGRRGYNEVVEKFLLISSTSEEVDEDQHAAALVVKEFFERTASQLTYYGLTRLHAALKERELAVLYRNMHFSTLFKCDGHLYVLVTDLGYQARHDVVWEKLDDVGGDTEFVDANFRPVRRTAPVSPDVSGDDASPDYLVALQLQQNERGGEAAAASSSSSYGGDTSSRTRVGTANGGTTPTDDDPELAAAIHLSRRLDDQERRRPAPGESREEADYRAALQLQLELDDEHARANGARSSSGGGGGGGGSGSSRRQAASTNGRARATNNTTKGSSSPSCVVS